MFFTDIEYNTERPHLIIPEYGRHIQKMVDQAVAEQDPEKRNKQAKSIISVMGNLNPHLRDVADFQHKLWDQLFIISDFKLDHLCLCRPPLKVLMVSATASVAPHRSCKSY